MVINIQPTKITSNQKMISHINFRGFTINFANNESFFKKVESGEWEAETFQILEKFIRYNKIFLDIGSWTGILSIYASILGADVFAIEPDPVAFPLMQDNIEANSLSTTVVCANVAIAEKNGKTFLNTIGEFGDSGSSIVNRPNMAEIKNAVTTRSLPNFIKEVKINPNDICLIKIDTEGSETLIIRGAKEYLQTFKPIMYISFHPTYFQDFEKDVVDIINTLFPIYNFVGSDEHDFLQRMRNENANHSFILIPK